MVNVSHCKRSVLILALRKLCMYFNLLWMKLQSVFEAEDNFSNNDKTETVNAVNWTER